MRKLFLRWPFLTLSFFLAVIFCLSPAQGAFLPSRAINTVNTSSSPEMERKLIISYLENMGWSRGDFEEALSCLSPAEIHDLSLSLEGIMAGSGDEGGKAGRVALVLIITVGIIIGLYLFATANK